MRWGDLIGGNFGILLQIFGMCFLTAALVFGGIHVYDILIDKYAKISWKWKIKHRFSGKPIAKCYCVDCLYYKDNCEINKTGRCSRLEKIVADNGFCKEAFPYRKDDCK